MSWNPAGLRNTWPRRLLIAALSALSSQAAEPQDGVVRTSASAAQPLPSGRLAAARAISDAARVDRRRSQQADGGRGAGQEPRLHRMPSRTSRDMHAKDTVRLGCSDCHGGNPGGRRRKSAPTSFRASPTPGPPVANPVRSYTLLNHESPEFIRFVNPGDLRVAHISCGTAMPARSAGSPQEHDDARLHALGRRPVQQRLGPDEAARITAKATA